MAIYAKTLYITDEGTYPLVLNRYTVTINISTNSSDLYGAAITVRLNGNIKEVIYFNGAGQAQYTAREEGAYSFSVTYGSEIISVEKVLGSSDDGKTYPLTINTPLTFDYQSWLNAGNVTGSYSSLEDVLEDEIAIRKLMTIHDAVDFLAGIDADDEGLITILNNDLCAKWITLRDYAEDTLTEAFGTLMTSIGKYGYGEWALMPQVPTMTSDTTPYGEASSYPDNTGTNYAAWKAFNGDISTGWSAYPAAPSVGQYIQYKFSQPTIIKYITYTKNDDDNEN